MTRARDLADYIATGVSDTELDILDGLTTTTAELNYNDTGAAVGTVVASKTVTVDANKDASSFRNITMAGDLSIAGDVVTVSNANLDLAPNGTGTVVVKGNDNSGAVVFNCENNSHGQKVYGQPHSASVTNTLMLPAGANSTLVSLVSTDTLTNKTLTSPKVNEDVAVTSTATELNLLDGVTATTAELNILDGVTSTAAELNTLDGVTAVVGELNALDLGSTAVGNAIASKAVILDSNKDYTGLRNVTATGAITGGSFVIGSADINENDLESIDGITAGTIAASKAAVVDSNKDVTGFRNITLTGELDAGSLDISGDIDVDGTTNLDVVDIDGALTQDGGAVFNEASADVDFRVESNDNANMLVVNGGDNSVGVGIATPTRSPFHVHMTTDDTDSNIHLTSNETGSASGDGFTLGVSAGGANDLHTYMIQRENADIRMYTNGTEHLKITNGGKVEVLVGGIDVEGGAVFNEDSADVDFRVEGNGDANLLFVDASTDRVGIGKSGPTELLDVDGTLNTTNLKVGGAQGSDGQVLTSTGSGVGWESIPASGGMTLISTATISNTTTNSFSMTSVLSGTYQNYFLISDGAGLVSSDEQVLVKVVDGGGVHAGGYVGKSQTAVGNASYSGWSVSSSSGCLMRFKLRAPDADQLGGGFKAYINFNTSNTTKINAMGEFFFDSGGNLFTSGGLVAESTSDSSAYSGTPSGLHFVVDDGSKYFANGMKVRLYGLTAS